MANLSPGVEPAPAHRSIGNRAARKAAPTSVVVGLYNRCLTQALCTYLHHESPDLQVCQPDRVPADFVPDLILTDLPNLEAGLTAHWPEIRILILDEGLDQQQVEKALRFPNVSGLIRGSCEARLLVKAIRCVLKDEVWIDSDTVKILLRNQSPLPRRSSTVHLTNKEKEIAELILQGLKNKEIAARVFLSESTVKVHISRIYKKHAVASRAELILKLTQTSPLH